jgi:alpha-glucosidase (family GH31 glycosyl hydrolase)
MAASPLIRILAPNAVRVTHFDASAQAQPGDRPWLADVLLELSNLEIHGNPITVSAENELVSAFNAQGDCFFRETAAPALGTHTDRPYFYFDIPQTALYSGKHRVDAGIRLTLQVTKDESFFGWGEWFNAFERKTGQIVLDNRNALFEDQDQRTYSGLPFYLSSRGYGFLLLNSHRSQWDLSAKQLTVAADGPGADYILIYGPTYKEILRTYTALTGRPPLLPRWAFGLWVTGYPQEDQNYVLEYVRRHREKKIPLDAVILDYHWEEKFHNFQWRRGLFPDPVALVAGLRAEGARLGLILTPFLNTQNRPLQKWLLNTFGQNVTPGLERDDERALDEFAEAKAKGYLAHENVRWWFGAGGMLDFTNPATAAWWKEKLRPLFELGVDFIKNDDGEDLPDDARTSSGMDGREYHNLYGFYYGKATYESRPAAPKMETEPGLRSLIYARTAWIGSQRYPALFLGDQKADFESLRRSIRAGLNLAMGGFSYWTADVFGLSGKTTPETHIRYAQWALLSPVARYFIRPEKIDGTRFPWSHNPQVEFNFRKYAELRMRLLPYYNSLAHESYLTGLPIMRPLTFEFQDDPRLRGVEDQIMLGEHLMLCPVVETGAKSRKITLPEGVWHDFWSERSWEGKIAIEYPAPLDRLPLLVRGGTILPMGPVLQNIPDEHVFDHLEFHLWPPYPAEGLFFDDDGRTTAYQQDGFARTRLRAEQNDKKVVIRISAAQGKFAGQATRRRVDLILHRAKNILSAGINGEDVSISNQADFVRVSATCLTQKDTLAEIIFDD